MYKSAVPEGYAVNSVLVRILLIGISMLRHIVDSPRLHQVDSSFLTLDALLLHFYI